MKKRNLIQTIVTISLFLLEINIQSQTQLTIATAGANVNPTMAHCAYQTNCSPNGWCGSIPMASNDLIVFDLGNTFGVTQINCIVNRNNNGTFNGFQIQGSTDGITYSTIKNVNISTTITTVSVNTNAVYRYVRFTGASYGDTPSSSPVYFSNVTIYGNTVSSFSNILVSGSATIGTTTPALIDYNGNILMSQPGYFGFRRTSDGLAIPMISVTANSNGTSNLQIGSGSGQFYGGYTDIFGGTSVKVRILSNGNVGIGTTSPVNTLDVEGGTVIGATYSGTNIAPANGLLVQGNVGIGTTNPSAPLTVKGLILAGQVKIVDVGTIPDYVFKPNYKLLSIGEIESFIKQNNHLPEVPSAKEVEEKGINVADMNNLLLKKVEELTLYVIELNKKVESLEKENQVLKSK
jgi:F5/8 type C domain